MPKTKLGKWSLTLILAMFALFFIGPFLADFLYESVPAGDSLFEDIVSRPALAIAMLLGFSAGVLAFVTGLISIFKHQERAVLVFVSTLVGAAPTIYLIAEFLLPD